MAQTIKTAFDKIKWMFNKGYNQKCIDYLNQSTDFADLEFRIRSLKMRGWE